MVRQFIENFRIFPKRRVILAVVLTTAFLISPIKAKISDSQVKEIKDMLEITNFPKFFEYSDENIKKVLNQKIEPKESDITYGILIQSAFNEIEFMDMILTQSYIGPARKYFNNVLERNLSLAKHWKSTGKKFYDVLKQGSAASPTRSLMMEIVPITQKTMEILVEIKALENTLVYRGLWTYFDRRRDGNSHEEAWFQAKPLMGSAPTRKVDNNWFRSPKEDKVNYILEAQFMALWEKWGPYVGPRGIKEEYKKQLAEEMRSNLLVALEQQALAKKRKEEEPSLLDKFVQKLNEIKNKVASLVSDINPFKAGPVVESSEGVEKSVEIEPEILAPEPEPEPEAPAEVMAVEPPSLEEIQDDLDDVLERVDIISEEVAPAPEPQPTPVPESEVTEIEEEIEEITEEMQETEDIEEPAEPEEIEAAEETKNTEGIEEDPEIIAVQPRLIEEERFCKYKGTAPRRFRVLINEVAWMGTENSSNDEWIELKNIWGIPVNLEGWRLQDKDRQIEIIFEENDVIPAGGYFLLERTDDDSIPDAPADKIYTGVINNTNENLYLFDADCGLEDKVSAFPDWPAGDNSGKKPMERFDIWNWYTSSVESGTPGEENTPPPAVLVYPSVPAPEEQEKVGCSPNSININIASQEELEKIIHIGLSRAQQIIELRQEKLFSSIDDLVRISGIGESRLADIKAQGCAYVEEINEEEEEEEEGEDTKPVALYLSVVINEIAWMGTNVSHSVDEWIELYNNTTSTVDLTGWKLVSADGGPDITFATSSIAAGEYFLIERTDDNAVSDTPADLISSFGNGLSNVGEDIELITPQGKVIDSVMASSTGWFAGVAATSGPSYISMERIDSLLPGSDPGNWASNNRITKNGLDAGGNPINGTPKAENSVSKDFTYLPNGLTTTEDLTLTYLGSPYLVEKSIAVSGAKLTVEPGVVIKFKPTFSLNFMKITQGSLAAVGAADKEIIFTSSSTEPQAGDWGGFYLEKSTALLKHAQIQYAGKIYNFDGPPYTYGAIKIDGGRLTMKNSFIEKSQTFGIRLQNSTSSQIINSEFKENPGWVNINREAAIYITNSNPIIKNSIFEDNKIAILVESGKPTIQNNAFIGNNTAIWISELLDTISGNTATNTARGIHFAYPNSSQAEISGENIIWPKTNLPYTVKNVILNPNTSLNIEKGVMVNFVGGYFQKKFIVKGKLLANGTPGQPIIFSSMDYILFTASSTGSVLDNVVIKNGGYYGGSPPQEKGTVIVENVTDFTVKNSLFDSNIVAGLELVNSTTTIEKTTFKNHDTYYKPYRPSRAIYVRSDPCPVMSQMTLEDNFENNLVDIDPERCNP